MTTYAILVLFYVVSGFAWFRRSGSPLHPAVIHAASWALPIAWHWAYSEDLTPISATLAVLLASASLAFFVPFLWSERRADMPVSPFLRAPVPRHALLAVTAIFMLPLLSLFLAIRVVGSLSEFSLTLLRNSFVEDAPPAIGIGFIFPIVVGAFFYVRQTASPRMLHVLAWASALLLAVLSTSKIYFFVLLFVALAPTMEKAKGALARRAVLAGFLGVAVFVLLHLALGKFIGADSVETPAEMVGAALLTLAVYFAGSISALDQELLFRDQIPDGYLYLGLPGAGQSGVSKILPFTFVNDIGVNVHTGYAPVLHEFGEPGLLALMFVLGFLYRFLYARRSSPGGTFLYAFSLFPLFFLFHSEFFLMAFYLWVGFLVVANMLTRTLAVEAPT